MFYINILITTIQVNLVPLGNSPELSLLKFLPLTYHHSHFLAATLDFTSFFTIACLRAALFLQLGCFGLDFTSFCICIPQSRPMADFRAFLTYHFFFTTGRRKDEAGWFLCSWPLYKVILLADLSTGWLVSSWSLYTQCDLFVAELSTGWFVCSWIFYRAICLQLNSLHGSFFVAEL